MSRIVIWAENTISSQRDSRKGRRKSSARIIERRAGVVCDQNLFFNFNSDGYFILKEGGGLKGNPGHQGHITEVSI